MALAVGGPPTALAALSALIGADLAIVVAAVVLGAVAATSLTVRAVLRPMTAEVVDARIAQQDAEAAGAALRRAVAVRDRFDVAAAAEATDAGVLRLLVQTAAELVPEHEVALLLSLPDEARVAWSVRTVGADLVPAEAIAGRPGCVALASRRPTSVDSVHELGACEHLRRSASDDALDAFDLAASCIPLDLGDRTLGVLCVTGAAGEGLDADRIALIEHLCATTGRRLGSLRRRRGPSTPGPVDPVTGLPTGPALRSRTAELVRSHIGHCVAVLRIDGAQAYRDAHGHSGWDDAMRLVADTTSATLRPDDVVCRIDDERLAAVLANCSTVQASAALERVRESTVLALTVAGVAHFTCSVGLVDGARGTSVDDTLRLADAAGQTALLQGGNRVVVADPSTT